MPANEQYLRDIKKSHVAFLGSVLVFAFATVLILYRDHDDEWRGYQRQFLRIEADNLRRDRQAVMDAAQDKGGYEKYLQELGSQIAATDAELQKLGKDLADAKRVAVEEKTKADLKGRDVRFARAHRDVARANYDLGIRDAVPDEKLAALKGEFDRHQEKVLGLESEWELQTTVSKEAAAALSKLTGELDKLNDQKKKFTAEVVRIEDALTDIAPAGGPRAWKRAFMEWPIVDGFNGHLEVKQDWLPELRIRLGMATPARFDRCRTCHLGIDRFGNGNIPTFPADKYEQPFTSHPRPDVFLTATSPHPINTFGCTVCHEGQGSATSFHNAQHGANDPHEDHDWNKKYGHFHNHFWEYPMFPERLREAACLKCHHDVVELGVNPTYGATAPKVVEGWNLIRQYGCFGCHEINGFDGKKRIGPDLRLEPTTEEEPKYAADPNLVRGNERKVGPSLKHVGQKTNANWIATWTKEPKAFRPNTRMPQFFGLTNLNDAHGTGLSEVEIAGISAFLVKQSTPVELLKPKNYGAADANNGKKLFAERGCLACHSHNGEDFKGATANFGPDLSNIGDKLLPGEAGENWLYTWIRDPERHHPRTKMPNLYLDPYQEDGKVVDPAADIAKFLIGEVRKSYEKPAFNTELVKDLARTHLAGKALTESQFDKFWSERKLPVKASVLKGDDVELASLAEAASADGFDQTMLEYVGRRAISRYGCYGCHDINGFGTGRPIGTGLADWGRKDTGRLALEHIEEFLHHHGEVDGSSTHKRVEKALADAAAGTFNDDADKESGLRAAYFYEDLAHHGRAGFIYQKLRDPRSYDYHKTETKKYSERLVMPKFPFSEQQIEAIASFVLGLVADPPASNYVYKPTQAKADRNKGEYLLEKFNCTGCHMTTLPQFEFVSEGNEFLAYNISDKDHKRGVDGLLKLRPAAPTFVGAQTGKDGKSSPIARFVGIADSVPDPEETDPDAREFTIVGWEPQYLADAAGIATAKAKGEQPALLLPGSKASFKEAAVVGQKAARGGKFAEWLVKRLAVTKTNGNRFLAWQASPPPLHLEGQKVQTPWLYRFLREPEQLRFTTVLRMPQFNISDEEAAALANYFAAADGAVYPYHFQPQLATETLSPTEFDLQQKPTLGADVAKTDESWKMLTTTLCIKCHQVAGREMDPKVTGVVRGPNLERVASRIRPEWLDVWLYNPSWITPYTSMPAPFAANAVGEKSAFPAVFGGNPEAQTEGVYNALLNYQRLLEKHGKAPAGPAPAAPAPAQN